MSYTVVLTLYHLARTFRSDFSRKDTDNQDPINSIKFNSDVRRLTLTETVGMK